VPAIGETEATDRIAYGMPGYVDDRIGLDDLRAFSLGGIAAAQQPDRPGFGYFRRKLCQIGQRADRGMPGTQHGHGLAGIAGALLTQYVGHPIGDPVGGLCLADRGEAIRARRIRRVPGAGYVDDRIGLDDLRAFTVLIPDFKRRGLAAPGLELVKARPADLGDVARRADVRLERGVVGERLEIALHHLRAGRVLVGFGRIPAGRRQQAFRCLVDVVFPGRE
jgi:hypothetical protein